MSQTTEQAMNTKLKNLARKPRPPHQMATGLYLPSPATSSKRLKLAKMLRRLKEISVNLPGK
jgi:hypothetical protein